MSIGELGEFGLIARITGRLGQGPEVELGPGDDAAVVRAPGGRVVATTDLLVEGRHFRRDWSPPYDIGRKAAAQNLADVVAMGARPTALLIGFGAPPDTAVDWVDALCDGLRDECAQAGASVAGGDVVRAETVVLGVTALGALDGPAITRSGARPGDVVAVAGRLGYAAAGVELLSEGRREPADLIDAHRRPRPPYAIALGARELGATAMLDVSDGLVQDLGHIAEASGVRIEIDAAAVPVPPVPDGLRLALTGGDDHAFAATFPKRLPLPAEWRTIGRVVEGPAGVVVDGRAYGAGGWDHFRLT
ncbi:thiamine-phosphate kinase [Actinoallomurus rhizosphaericola]|uniref:thiamine-phosphate kinase n=1 Tax=Actinoallomurus rhizosphaericola TaxID=2952536 RepID=UPI0027E2B36C|nr:thiamine-phosphate kinase [Actinoallomurus rhizosphaericola]